MKPETTTPWYTGVTRYQWLVLLLASLGWVFDVFEGQIFVASEASAQTRDLYNNLAFAAFLLGGAVGGVLFGILSDRVGRKRVMTYTIVMYSIFTALSALSQTWWQMAGLRFFVAMGVGGEWAVAATMVAEVFPKRARAWSQSIFHASSVLGTYLAVLSGTLLVAHQTLILGIPGTGFSLEVAGWRVGFAVGVLPALLIIWIRTTLHEPEVWTRSREEAGELPATAAEAHFAKETDGEGIQPDRRGITTSPEPAAPEPIADVRRLSRGQILGRLALGICLAGVGLATFWGAHVYGKDVFRAAYVATLVPPGASAEQQAQVVQANSVTVTRFEMLGMFLVTTGGGIGLVCFGPLSEWLGRRGAFLFFHLGGLASALALFLGGWGLWAVGAFLPVFGFLTLGMHAGYAVYFPELFPTRLRGTGAGFCFNGGRLLAAPVLLLRGLLTSLWGFTLFHAAALLSLLFLVGALLLFAAPETRGQDLPE
jgi:MFS family permease